MLFLFLSIYNFDFNAFVVKPQTHSAIILSRKVVKPLNNDQQLKNMVGSSKLGAYRSISVRTFLLIISMCYISTLFISHLMTPRESVYWSGYDLQVENEFGVWVNKSRMEIGSESHIQNIRFFVQIDEDDIWKQPVSITLGGPFSADIYWDSAFVGHKETIDFSALVPANLLHAGEHQIRIRLSTQKLKMPDNSILHHVWLTPYRYDGQRYMRYYTVPLLIFSGLLLLSFQSVRIGRSTGNYLYTGLGIYGFFIVLALLTEVARAAINYPYNYHDLRSVIGFWVTIGAGLTLMLTSYRMNQSRLSIVILACGFSVVLILYALPLTSEDTQLAYAFISLVTSASFVFLRGLLAGQIGYLSVLPIFCITCCISAFWSIGLFLDSYLFVASIILIGGAWLWTYVEVSQQTNDSTQDDVISELTIKTSDGNKHIKLKDCCALKAEGNFTSVIQLNGEKVLHQDGLGLLLETLPSQFVRVHRSFAVNLHQVLTLKSSPGSKYWLEMSNKERIPVSRYRAAEIRSLLKSYV